MDGPQGRPRDAIHLVFAGEKASPEQMFPAPDVTESETVGSFRVITLDALVTHEADNLPDSRIECMCAISWTLA